MYRRNASVLHCVFLCTLAAVSATTIVRSWQDNFPSERRCSFLSAGLLQPQHLSTTQVPHRPSDCTLVRQVVPLCSAAKCAVSRWVEQCTRGTRAPRMADKWNSFPPSGAKLARHSGAQRAPELRVGLPRMTEVYT